MSTRTPLVAAEVLRLAWFCPHCARRDAAVQYADHSEGRRTWRSSHAPAPSHSRAPSPSLSPNYYAPVAVTIDRSTPRFWGLSGF